MVDSNLYIFDIHHVGKASFGWIIKLSNVK